MLYLSKKERQRKTYYRDVRRLICETLSISDREFERAQPAWKKFLKTFNEAHSSAGPNCRLGGDKLTLCSFVKDVKGKALYRAMAMAICLSPEAYPSLFFWNGIKHPEGSLGYFEVGHSWNKVTEPRLARFSLLLLERNIREIKNIAFGELRSPLIMSDPNSDILQALRILQDDDILAQKLFDLYNLDSVWDNQPMRRSLYEHHIDGFHSFGNLLRTEPIPIKWKIKADEKMRSLILKEQKKEMNEPCRSLLAYSQHVQEWLSLFEQGEKRLKATGMFSPEHVKRYEMLPRLCVKQLEFIFSFELLWEKLYVISQDDIPNMYRIFSGEEYKKLRHLLVKAVVFLNREHPRALWRFLADDYVGGQIWVDRFLCEFADDEKLVARLKKDMAEAKALKNRNLIETERMNKQLQLAFDCLK